jgi:hypothetical protein
MRVLVGVGEGRDWAFDRSYADRLVVEIQLHRGSGVAAEVHTSLSVQRQSRDALM